MTDDLWRAKIVGLLYTCPQRSLLLGGRGADDREARDLAQAALGSEVPGDLWRRAGVADRIASASDQWEFPAEVAALCSQRLVFRHPLSGVVVDLDLPGGIDATRVTEWVRQAAQTSRAECAGVPDKLFLRLWRHLADDLKAAGPEGAALGASWDLLPADPCMPHTTVWDHARIVAALTAAMPEAALLVMSIGPVQDFIARSARKTGDLWAGSWILSWLAWQGMKTIADRWGPDAVLFPDLRRQPLVDLWLRREKGVTHGPEPRGDVLATPSLPNRWVAVLPAAVTEAAARDAAEAIQAGWLRLAADVRRHAGVHRIEVDEAQWQRQHRWVEVYWTAHRWPPAANSNVDGVERGLARALGPGGTSDAPLAPGGPGRDLANLGRFYGRLHDLASRFHGSRKMLRDFPGGAEPGYKCTLCGEREPLHGPSIDSRDHRGLVTWWGGVAAGLHPGAIRPEGGERLCGVCLVKRLAPTILAGVYGIDPRFPSTSEVAATTFKLCLLAGAARHDKLRHALTALSRTVPAHEIGRGASVPAVARTARALSHQIGESIAAAMVGVDGEWFFDESYESDDAVTRLGVARRPMRDALREVCEQAASARIAGPAPYYAVIMMDGDRMGQWVAGAHPDLPTIAACIHPDAVASARARIGEAALARKRPQSPALQGALSASLLGFGLDVARHVVEVRHAGRIVYAGGDDVLAVAPLADVLAIADGLQQTFHDLAFVRSDTVVLGLEAIRPLLREADGGVVRLGMGATATASAGIAIAHHIQPLAQVLAAARQMEGRAKTSLGRAACSIALMKRSGSHEEAGAPWRFGATQETAPLLGAFVGLFEGRGGLSARLLVDLEQERAGFAVIPSPAARRRVEYLMRRHVGPGGRERVAALARDLVDLVTVLGGQLGGIEAGWTEAIRLLAVAEFVARYPAGRAA